jgi:hypothetical protein
MNENLINCTGLENITTINGSLTFYSNYAMTNLAGLDNVVSISNSVSINNHFALSDLAALGNLTTIGGQLSFENNYLLPNMNGLEKLSSIGGSLIIYSNNILSTLSGLDSLTAIGGKLDISSNNSLTNLLALNSLTSIDGELAVYHNNKLMSLEGLNNIGEFSIENLEIFANSSLSTCHVESICNYLASPNGEILISGNASGCNSREEVEEMCMVVNDEYPKNENSFTFYPNPARNHIFLQNTASEHVEILIYNELGNILLQKFGIIHNVDISNLKSGFYIVELLTKESHYKHKLIVKK